MVQFKKEGRYEVQIRSRIMKEWKRMEEEELKERWIE